MSFTSTFSVLTETAQEFPLKVNDGSDVQSKINFSNIFNCSLKSYDLTFQRLLNKLNFMHTVSNRKTSYLNYVKTANNDYF